VGVAGLSVPESRHSGSCLCGSVSFTIQGPLRPVLVCHCSQCRKTSGHYWAATAAPPACVDISDSGTLTWFSSSVHAQRGFCNRCGASLFWRSTQQKELSIAAGCLDAPTGLQTREHIFFADASDYYLVHPSEPRRMGSDE